MGGIWHYSSIKIHTLQCPFSENASQTEPRGWFSRFCRRSFKEQSQVCNIITAHSSAITNSTSRPAPKQFFIPLNVVFYVCLLSNTLAASLAPIQDCDEVFNYWEPTHYLVHGYGLQTWEYSPEYSIRSWLYVSLHAGIAKISTFVARSKSAQFYFVRMALAFMCTACETRIYSAISRTLNPRIGVIFVMIMVFSPGMFHASTAMLPSSFTMYTSMLGTSAFMDWRGGLKTGRGIMWFGIGAILGWPFAGALVLPFLLEEIAVGYVSKIIHRTLIRFTEGAMRCLIFLVSYFYNTNSHVCTNKPRLLRLLLIACFTENLSSFRGISFHITCLVGAARGPTFSEQNPGPFIFETCYSISTCGLY